MLENIHLSIKTRRSYHPAQMCPLNTPRKHSRIQKALNSLYLQMNYVSYELALGHVTKITEIGIHLSLRSHQDQTYKYCVLTSY